VACTDFAIFSAGTDELDFVAFLKIMSRLTEGHKLRTDRDREHNEVQDFNHLQVRE
jgi:hypothetical protein